MGMYILKMTRFIVLLAITFVLLTSCGGDKIESQRMKAPITIDGIADEWNEYCQFYYEEWKTMYSIVNDDTSISIIIQFRDNQLARKINTRGFTIWLNSDGDEENNWGIHYEDRELMDKMLNDMADGKEMPNRENRSSEVNNAVEFSGTFSLVDKDKNLLSENRQNGIYAEALYDQGSYCFEYKIMFDAVNFNSDFFKITLDSDLKLGIELAAVSEEFKEIMQQKMSDRMKDGMRPGGGETRGGGMRGGGKRGGGMGGPPGGGRENMMKDVDAQEVWLTVILAY